MTFFSNDFQIAWIDRKTKVYLFESSFFRFMQPFKVKTVLKMIFRTYKTFFSFFWTAEVQRKSISIKCQESYVELNI